MKKRERKRGACGRAENEGTRRREGRESRAKCKMKRDGAAAGGNIKIERREARGRAKGKAHEGKGVETGLGCIREDAYAMRAGTRQGGAPSRGCIDPS